MKNMIWENSTYICNKKSKLGKQGCFLNLLKDICEIPTSNNIANAFPLRLEKEVRALEAKAPLLSLIENF